MEIVTDFLEPGELSDGRLSLVIDELIPADSVRGQRPAYQFAMTLPTHRDRIGRISLRLGADDFLVNYAGQIGYGVDESHRGHRYAATSCRLLLPLARRHGFDELWITCNPENIASRRTCEIAGAEFVEIVDLPPHTDMYAEGERFKARYRLPVPRFDR